MHRFRRITPPTLFSLVAAMLLPISLFSSSDEGVRLEDASDGRNWAAYGRTFGEQHYSPLSEINDSNVGGLGLPWAMDLGPGSSATMPLAIDGILYFATGYSVVHAVEAATGTLLWIYDPKVGEAAGRKLRLGWGSRGIAWWNGKIYTGTHDGRLIAIDASTGKSVWSVMTVGEDDYRFISGAPRVIGAKIIVGHGGADGSTARGYVTTYDAETGKQLWRFFTVPGDPAKGFENDVMEMAAKTWSGTWWKYGGGGTVWNAMTYDADNDVVYLGVGNGSPWNHRIRSDGKGDNLFLCSVIAVNASTGRYQWHYQFNPADSWDYNASQDMELAELTIAGRQRKVLMTAPKNGFFYVIDRADGRVISAEPYVKVSWATKIDLVNGRPVEVPGIRYPDGKPFTMWPGPAGAHSSQPMAYSPQTGLAYIPAMQMPIIFSDKGITRENWIRVPGNASDGAVDFALVDRAKNPEAGTSSLIAWNPITQRLAWSQPTPALWNGGVLASGGNLVFQGKIDGKFDAYAADTGKRLWSFAAQAPISAAPITYSVNGRQYVTVLTGISGSGAMFGMLNGQFKIDPRTMARRVLTFVLDGRARLPRAVVASFESVADPMFMPDAAGAARGALIFQHRCMACHGFGAVSGGFATDLRISAIPQSADAFAAILLDGKLESSGMPRFEELTDPERDDLRQYIRTEGRKISQ